MIGIMMMIRRSKLSVEKYQGKANSSEFKILCER